MCLAVKRDEMAGGQTAAPAGDPMGRPLDLVHSGASEKRKAEPMRRREEKRTLETERNRAEATQIHGNQTTGTRKH